MTRRIRPPTSPHAAPDPTPHRQGEGKGAADERQPPLTLAAALRCALNTSTGRQGGPAKADRSGSRAGPSTRASRRGRLLPLQDVAEQIQVSIKTVRRWIERGLLPAHRLGRVLRVSEEDLDAFISRHRH
jgi:excisionase family DNA binding protein